MQRPAAAARLIGMGSGIRITAGVAAAVIAAAGCGQAVAVRPRPTAVSRGVAASHLAVTPRALGAADTAISVPPAEISFDRPYVPLVTATHTGEPLFLARVADPAV